MPNCLKSYVVFIFSKICECLINIGLINQHTKAIVNQASAGMRINS